MILNSSETTSGPLSNGKALKKCTIKAVYIKSFGGQKGGSSEPPRTPPAYGPAKWLKERPQVSSEDVHYVLFFCGNLFTSGPQVPSSGKDPLALSVVVRPYQVDQTSDR